MTQETLKQLFEYRDGGLFHRTGRRAGSPQSKGYWRIKIQDKSYFEHRLVWFYHHGVWPDVIDHLNGVRCDNRIENLRSVTVTENVQRRNIANNNTSGFKGVYYRKDRGLWKAQLQHAGRAYTANFNDIEDAATYYNFIAAELFGENALYNSVTQPWLEDQNPDGSTFTVAELEPVTEESK